MTDLAVGLIPGHEPFFGFECVAEILRKVCDPSYLGGQIGFGLEGDLVSFDFYQVCEDFVLDDAIIGKVVFLVVVVVHRVVKGHGQVPHIVDQVREQILGVSSSGFGFQIVPE